MAAGPTARAGGISDGMFFGLFAAIPAVFAIVWTAAQLSALATSGRSAGIGVADTARAVPRLPGNASDPAAAWPAPTNVGGPVAFWTAALVVTAVLFGVLLVLAARFAGPGGRPGMARRGDLGSLRKRAVLGQADGLRPDLQEAGKDELLAGAGVRLGRQWRRGPELWGTVEDSFLVIAPPRIGKTARVVVPTVVDHDGPAVVTSTRWDVVRLTAPARSRRGPVWVFDADQESEAVLPAGVARARWSPVAGAEDPQTARIRARSFARASGAGEGITDSGFWQTHAERVLRFYLHAAALDGKGIADVRRWADDPELPEPATILRSSPVAPGWAGELSSLVRVSDRQRDGVWGVVQQALDALADPRLAETCSPPPGTGFDPAELLARSGTLYVVGAHETQDVVAPLVSALVEAVTTAARRRAVTSPGGRLAPPLLLALDEVANIAPLPTLPTLLADGGGTGITTMIVLQSRAQARDRWGEDAAEAIVAACTHRLILGGGGDLNELEDLSRLVGERDEETRSHSYSPWGSAQGTGSSTQTSLRRIPIITPADLQSMPKGRGVLCSPASRPVEVWLDAWWERPDAASLRAGSEQFTTVTSDMDYEPREVSTDASEL